MEARAVPTVMYRPPEEQETSGQEVPIMLVHSPQLKPKHQHETVCWSWWFIFFRFRCYTWISQKWKPFKEVKSLRGTKEATVNSRQLLLYHFIHGGCWHLLLNKPARIRKDSLLYSLCSTRKEEWNFISNLLLGKAMPHRRLHA